MAHNFTVSLCVLLAITGFRCVIAQDDTEEGFKEVFGKPKDNEDPCECVSFFLCQTQTNNGNSGSGNNGAGSNGNGDNGAGGNGNGDNGAGGNGNGDNGAGGNGNGNNGAGSNEGGNSGEDNYGENVIDIRLGETGQPVANPCSHYLQKCCAQSNFTRPTPRPKVPKKHTCGNRNTNGVDFKITGNTHNEAEYGEFPWMVAILRRGKEHINASPMEGGGSIIHPQVILTAAHTVKGKQDLIVRAGEWDSQTDKEPLPIQERNVQQVIIHEEYYAGGLHNDVALLVLDSPLELTDVVGTICLPAQDENMDGRNCIVSGWGKDSFGREGKYQVILKKIEQPTIERNKCQEKLRTTRLGKHFKLHESLMCAGGEIGKDACKGDGGGPLVCPSKNNPEVYVQAGIVAWGIGCGSEIPAVYGNVPRFINWIENKLYANKIII